MKSYFLKNIKTEVFKAFQYSDFPNTEEQQDKMTDLFRENMISISRDNQHELDGSVGFFSNNSFGKRIYRDDWIVICGLGEFAVYSNDEFKEKFIEYKEL